MTLPPYDAVVLAGGAGRRLGGADKPGIRVGGRPLLDRVLDAVADAARAIVVGPPRPTGRAATWVREEPAGGGPVAALAAALPLATSGTIAVLAADLPFLTAGVVALLRHALAEGAGVATGAARAEEGAGRAAADAAAGSLDGALLVDGDGRDQLLVGVWRTDALRGALARHPVPAGVPFRVLVGGLAVRRVAAAQDDHGRDPTLDCDTEDDLRRAEEQA